jgi:hypothetical protein
VHLWPEVTLREQVKLAAVVAFPAEIGGWKHAGAVQTPRELRDTLTVGCTGAEESSGSPDVLHPVALGCRLVGYTEGMKHLVRERDQAESDRGVIGGC